MTLNANLHPVMYRMHKPDPEFGPDHQDKRSVVPIEPDDVDTCGSLPRRSPLQRGAGLRRQEISMPAPSHHDR